MCVCVCVCGLQTEVSEEGGGAEWRELRGHEALKGRKLYRNRDSVDPNVCPGISGLSEMFIAVYIVGLL